MPRILITDGMDKSAIAKLKELGHEVDIELAKAQIVKHLAEKLKIEIYK